ncbi:MAG: preprotein translocase subunit SecE [Chlamydiota bacterium]
MSVVTRSKKQKKKGLVAEIQQELQKVTWTSKEELRTFTKIVIGSTFFFGMSVYLTDLTMQSFLQGIGQVCKWIMGGYA